MIRNNFKLSTVQIWAEMFNTQTNAKHSLSIVAYLRSCGFKVFMHQNKSFFVFAIIQNVILFRKE